MPTITVPDDTYRRLAERAAAQGTTVEQLAAPALEQLAGGAGENGHTVTSPADPPYDEWKRRFDEWMAVVDARAGRYPPGFQADVSRESIYEGCGE